MITFWVTLFSDSLALPGGQHEEMGPEVAEDRVARCLPHLGAGPWPLAVELGQDLVVHLADGSALLVRRFALRLVPARTGATLDGTSVSGAWVPGPPSGSFLDASGSPRTSVEDSRGPFLALIAKGRYGTLL